MTPAVKDPAPPATARHHKTTSSTLSRHVHQLLGSLYPKVSTERRHYDRAPIPYLFQLTPLDADGQPLLDQTMTVVGRDISLRGMSFFHEQQLPYRRAIVSLDHPDAPPFTAEIDIRWCRFAKVGWYESGGRLLRSVGDLQAG